MRRMQSDKHAEIEAHLTKNRIAAVDITRVLAALIVMYEHLGFFGLAGRFGGEAFRICSITIGPCSTVFFIFAGYFACRNISWKKAFNNAWWCFAPFMLWCCIAALVMGNFSWHIFGLDSLVTFGTLHNVPINGPLWFMRDLIFLFLLSPLIYRFSRILLPVIFIMSSLPQLFMIFNTHPTMVLSPYALSFFSLGCFFEKGTQRTSAKNPSFFFFDNHCCILSDCHYGIGCRSSWGSLSMRNGTKLAILGIDVLPMGCVPNSQAN